jgi:hypothetical protein
MQGTVTLNRCTLDLTQANNYSTAWTRTASLTLTVKNSAILSRQNTFYGLIDGALHTDTIAIDHSLIQGPTSYILVHNYDLSGANVTYADALAGAPGMSVTNTLFVTDAMLDSTTYVPLAGSPAIGKSIPVSNAPDYSGQIWATRRTAGALEFPSPMEHPPSLDGVADPLEYPPVALIHDAGNEVPA